MDGRDIFINRTFENALLFLDLKTKEMNEDNKEVMNIEKRDLYAVSEVLEKNKNDAEKVVEFQKHLVPFVESAERAFDIKYSRDVNFDIIDARQEEFFKFIERNINSKIDSKIIDGKNF